MRLIDADALNERMYHDAFETDSDMQKWDGGCWIRYKMFENAIKDAPTIEPEQRWIPVTERLPDPYISEWLCCTADGSVEELWYDSPRPNAECEFLYYDEDGYPVVVPDVIAWMPLPDPYEEVTT